MPENVAYTVLDVRELTDGRRRVLVRKQGGRLVRITVAPLCSSGPDVDDLIGQVLASWPEIPSARLLEG